MSRRPSKVPAPGDPPEPLKSMQIFTPRDLHRQFTLVATALGLVLSDAVNDAMRDYVAKHAGEVLDAMKPAASPSSPLLLAAGDVDGEGRPTP
jgi:hypothetical protein